MGCDAMLRKKRCSDACTSCRERDANTHELGSLTVHGSLLLDPMGAQRAKASNDGRVGMFASKEKQLVVRAST